jgi:hypothetical protein
LRPVATRSPNLLSPRVSSYHVITNGDVEDLLREYNDKDVLDKYFAALPIIPVPESMYYMTNYYEYIAAAIFTGDLDEELINETIGSHMRTWYSKYETFIIHNKNLNLQNGITQTTIFINLWWLMKKGSFRPASVNEKLKTIGI